MVVVSIIHLVQNSDIVRGIVEDSIKESELLNEVSIANETVKRIEQVRQNPDINPTYTIYAKMIESGFIEDTIVKKQLEDKKIPVPTPSQQGGFKKIKKLTKRKSKKTLKRNRKNAVSKKNTQYK